MIAKAIAENKNLNISDLCKFAKVQRTSYYYWQKNMNARFQKDQAPLTMIKAIFEKRRFKSGIRTITMEIPRKFGVQVNHKKVARIKKEYGLVTQIRKHKSKHLLGRIFEHATKKNILNRQFHPTQVDQVYCTDITELKLHNGQKVYLSAMKDLCSREIVSYDISSTPGISLSLNTADKALQKLTNDQKANLIIHSDQGFHYTSSNYQHLLQQAEVQQSMSRRGNCLDNAPIESFFGHLKDEADYSQCANLESVKKVIAKYIDYYNNQRPQWTLNKKSPAECRGSLVDPVFL